MTKEHDGDFSYPTVPCLSAAKAMLGRIGAFCEQKNLLAEDSSNSPFVVPVDMQLLLISRRGTVSSFLGLVSVQCVQCKESLPDLPPQSHFIAVQTIECEVRQVSVAGMSGTWTILPLVTERLK
jgi:hypothetical protein